MKGKTDSTVRQKVFVTIKFKLVVLDIDCFYLDGERHYIGDLDMGCQMDVLKDVLGCRQFSVDGNIVVFGGFSKVNGLPMFIFPPRMDVGIMSGLDTVTSEDGRLSFHYNPSGSRIDNRINMILVSEKSKYVEKGYLGIPEIVKEDGEISISY